MMYEENSSCVTQEGVEEEVKMSQESAALMQKQQQMEAELQMAKMSMNDEEFKQHQKMKRLEAEAKMKAMRAAEPQKPKEITVVAGDGKHVKIQLGGDQNEDSRKQVAEAAGLKHVPLPDFDDSANSAWAD